MNVSGHIAVLRLEFQKCRILEILNSHPCIYIKYLKNMDFLNEKLLVAFALSAKATNSFSCKN